jgi:hypothetical protein
MLIRAAGLSSRWPRENLHPPKMLSSLQSRGKRAVTLMTNEILFPLNVHLSFAPLDILK